MKRVLTVMILMVPAAANAQAFQQDQRLTTGNQPAFGLVGVAPDLNVFRTWRSDDTPTMRRQRLQWAQTLRTEVAAMLVADGGTLSEAHRYYVRRKVAKILQ